MPRIGHAPPRRVRDIESVDLGYLIQIEAKDRKILELEAVIRDLELKLGEALSQLEEWRHKPR